MLLLPVVVVVMMPSPTMSGRLHDASAEQSGREQQCRTREECKPERSFRSHGRALNGLGHVFHLIMSVALGHVDRTRRLRRDPGLLRVF
jgi:hypothetical protein